jgi:hypothetical protein
MLCYDKCNALDNQRILQTTPTIFSYNSLIMDVVIKVETVLVFKSATHALIGLMFGN